LPDLTFATRLQAAIPSARELTLRDVRKALVWDGGSCSNESFSNTVREAAESINDYACSQFLQFADSEASVKRPPSSLKRGQHGCVCGSLGTSASSGRDDAPDWEADILCKVCFFEGARLMHGRISPWCAWTLTAVVAMAASAQAQEQEAIAPQDNYAMTGQASAEGGQPYADAGQTTSETGVPGTLVSDPKPAPDLAQRIEALEKALQKANDKELTLAKEKASKPTVVVGGMIQTDAAMFSQDAASRVQFPKGGTGADGVRNGVDFRRARIKVTGEGFSVIEYSLEMDFATLGSTTPYSAAFKDCFIGVKELPLVGNIRLGHFKEPFGLEQLISDRFSTFMERSVADEGAIVPGRNWGVMAYDWAESERMTWAIGTFVTQMPDNPPVYRENSGGWATTMRVSALPWYDEASDGRGLIHTAVAYSYRDAANGAMSLSAKPEAYLGPTVVDINGAGTLTNVNNNQLLGAEAAMVYGSLSLQAEYYMDRVDFTNRDSVQLNGCYAMASYFLTGEHRPYNRKTGTFDRIKPLENFFRVQTCDGSTATGIGAWEIAYRYSMLDLNAVDPRCGAVFDNTLGVNWYLNPNTRVMWDYVHSQVDRSKSGLTSSDMDVFEMRFAVDF
jgi:phosphate-selective porin OprO/OprP